VVELSAGELADVTELAGCELAGVLELPGSELELAGLELSGVTELFRCELACVLELSGCGLPSGSEPTGEQSLTSGCSLTLVEVPSSAKRSVIRSKTTASAVDTSQLLLLLFEVVEGGSQAAELGSCCKLPLLSQAQGITETESSKSCC
jgi:hypothetical protein